MEHHSLLWLWSVSFDIFKGTFFLGLSSHLKLPEGPHPASLHWGWGVVWRRGCRLKTWPSRAALDPSVEWRWTLKCLGYGKHPEVFCRFSPCVFFQRILLGPIFWGSWRSWMRWIISVSFKLCRHSKGPMAEVPRPRCWQRILAISQWLQATPVGWWLVSISGDTPIAGWFMMETPMKMDDLWPYFRKPPYHTTLYIRNDHNRWAENPVLDQPVFFRGDRGFGTLLTSCGTNLLMRWTWGKLKPLISPSQKMPEIKWAELEASFPHFLWTWGNFHCCKPSDFSSRNQSIGAFCRSWGGDGGWWNPATRPGAQAALKFPSFHCHFPHDFLRIFSTCSHHFPNMFLLFSLISHHLPIIFPSSSHSFSHIFPTFPLSQSFPPPFSSQITKLPLASQASKSRPKPRPQPRQESKTTGATQEDLEPSRLALWMDTDGLPFLWMIFSADCDHRKDRKDRKGGMIHGGFLEWVPPNHLTFR